MIGISSFAYHDLSLGEALQNIEHVANCAEIFSEGKHDLFRQDEIAFSYELEYTVHAPSTDLNFASIREPIRNAALQLVEDMADICNEIDAEVMVVHPGYFPFAYDRDFAFTAFQKSLPVLERIGEDAGVRICVENMPKWECFLFREPDFEIGANDFVLDIGHANTMGNLEAFLEREISHFHIHDNHGNNDEHLPPGEGNIDFSAIQGLLRQNNSIKIIENKSAEDALQSISALKNMGVK
jgi:sugar phosphate isomerase/epimerase